MVNSFFLTHVKPKVQIWSVIILDFWQSNQKGHHHCTNTKNFTIQKYIVILITIWPFLKPIISYFLAMGLDIIKFFV